MKTLWTKQDEEDFFLKSLEIARPEQLFYLTREGKYYAYWPKGYEGTKGTLQSRNAFIGSYTEKWCSDLFEEIAKEVGGFTVESVICEEIGLTNRSPADVAICKTAEVIQSPESILLILEVKMSAVRNWQLHRENDGWRLTCIGDYRTHQGNPSLLRSDTMLKAIGKSINIRVSSHSASKIPIVIIGNTPITNAYYQKVDHLKTCGIVQGFWSVNPRPLDDDSENIKRTDHQGFKRFDSFEELKDAAIGLLKEEREFFSSMRTKRELGQIIEVANQENTYEKKAQKFLELIRSPIG